MSFTPAIPFSGYAGWTFLKRTMPTQVATLNATSQNKREEEYFRSNIGKIDTAAQLVNDRRLLNVALKAFGLENDINNKFFIQKVLQDGTFKPDALANRLANKQYQQFSAAFGFGDFSTPRNKISDFADKVLAQFRTRQFESAVGQQNGDLRLALNVTRELPEIAAKTNSSENAKWFTIMGNPPLRKVFETALGLPQNTAALDLDLQLNIFKTRARSQFGSDTISQFTSPTATEALTRRFILRSENNAFEQTSAANGALTLLQQAVNTSRMRRL